MRKAMLRFTVGAVAMALPFVGAGQASAAAPNNHACFGHDFSGYAKDFHPLGRVLTTFAFGGVPIIAGGLGDEVQAHLAGVVPDSVIPNTCND